MISLSIVFILAHFNIFIYFQMAIRIQSDTHAPGPVPAQEQLVWHVQARPHLIKFQETLHGHEHRFGVPAFCGPQRLKWQPGPVHQGWHLVCKGQGGHRGSAFNIDDYFVLFNTINVKVVKYNSFRTSSLSDFYSYNKLHLNRRNLDNNKTFCDCEKIVNYQWRTFIVYNTLLCIKNFVYINKIIFGVL